MKNKITIIGAGNVGSTIAMILAEKELGDIVLLDIIEDMPEGKALDMMESLPVNGCNTKITGTNSYEYTRNSDIIVITSGVTRRPGMSRDELLETNAKIVRDVIKNAVQKSPNSIIIMVSNPLDAMAYAAYKISRFPGERVIGMSGILDSARFRTFISMELNVSITDIHALVLGGHGDSMVPLVNYTDVAGIPISKLIPRERLNEIIQRTRKGGEEIVNLLKTGSAYYAPAASTAEMVEVILKDKKKILPCSVLCRGEYGFSGIFLGLPVKLGRSGIEEIIEIELSEEEKKALQKSAESVRELCNVVDRIII